MTLAGRSASMTAGTFTAIWGDSLGTETMPTEVDLSAPEDGFADVDGDVRLLQPVQHSAKTLVMLLQCLTCDEDVIKVMATSFHSQQQVVQQLLARRTSRDQAEGDPSEPHQPVVCDERCDVRAVGMQFQLVVCRVEIGLAVELALKLSLGLFDGNKACPWNFLRDYSCLLLQECLTRICLL